eukprot:366131-Chlamydomonas_euryale.AAC.21
MHSGADARSTTGRQPSQGAQACCKSKHGCPCGCKRAGDAHDGLAPASVGNLVRHLLAVPAIKQNSCLWAHVGAVSSQQKLARPVDHPTCGNRNSSNGVASLLCTECISATLPPATSASASAAASAVRSACVSNAGSTRAERSPARDNRKPRKNASDWIESYKRWLSNMSTSTRPTRGVRACAQHAPTSMTACKVNSMTLCAHQCSTHTRSP